MVFAACGRVQARRGARMEARARFPARGGPASSGIAVTALHNHFFFDEPKVYFLHVAGEGTTDMVAGAVGRALGKVKVGADMGVNRWAAFAGSDADASVDGDFAVLESELQPVLRSLRSSRIDIVAIHHHMAGEEPRMLFLHYWDRGSAASPAKAVKAALSRTAR